MQNKPEKLPIKKMLRSAWGLIKKAKAGQLNGFIPLVLDVADVLAGYAQRDFTSDNECYRFIGDTARLSNDLRLMLRMVSELKIMPAREMEELLAQAEEGAGHYFIDCERLARGLMGGDGARDIPHPDLPAPSPPAFSATAGAAVPADPDTYEDPAPELDGDLGELFGLAQELAGELDEQGVESLEQAFSQAGGLDSLAELFGEDTEE